MKARPLLTQWWCEQREFTLFLIIKVNKLFSFFSLRCFLKEIENMYSMFLSSYTNTRESLGELEKAVETLSCGSCSHSISRSPKLPLVFVQLNRNTVHVFYFLNTTQVNSTFCTCWLASSEVISQVPFTSEQPKKNKMAFVDILSQINSLFWLLVFQLCGIYTKTIFHLCHCQWKWWIFTSTLVNNC